MRRGKRIAQAEVTEMQRLSDKVRQERGAVGSADRPEETCKGLEETQMKSRTKSRNAAHAGTSQRCTRCALCRLPPPVLSNAKCSATRPGWALALAITS